MDPLPLALLASAIRGGFTAQGLLLPPRAMGNQLTWASTVGLDLDWAACGGYRASPGTAVAIADLIVGAPNESHSGVPRAGRVMVAFERVVGERSNRVGPTVPTRAASHHFRVAIRIP